jgi:hypothetical protein
MRAAAAEKAGRANFAHAGFVEENGGQASEAARDSRSSPSSFETVRTGETERSTMLHADVASHAKLLKPATSAGETTSEIAAEEPFGKMPGRQKGRARCRAAISLTGESGIGRRIRAFLAVAHAV